jgi:hypothetical protein
MRTVGHRTTCIAIDHVCVIDCYVVLGTFDMGIFVMARRQRDDGSGKRSEVVTVRLDPKLKYLAELAARKQRRPLSSYVEWAIEQSLSQVHLEEDFNNNTVSVADAERMHHLWDLDEADRIVRLAVTYPELLTHEEQMVWKLIRENGLLWKGKYAGDPPQWTWQVEESSILWDRLREYWPILLAVANGSRPRTDLPTWQKTKPLLSGGRAADIIDDDIPF